MNYILEHATSQASERRGICDRRCRRNLPGQHLREAVGRGRLRRRGHVIHRRGRESSRVFTPIQRPGWPGRLCCGSKPTVLPMFTSSTTTRRRRIEYTPSRRHVAALWAHEGSGKVPRLRLALDQTGPRGPASDWSTRPVEEASHPEPATLPLDGGDPVPCSLALVEGHQVKQDVQKGKRLPGFGTLKAKVCAVSGPRLLDSAFGRAGPRVPESPPDPCPASMPADSIPQLNSPT